MGPTRPEEYKTILTYHIKVKEIYTNVGKNQLELCFQLSLQKRGRRICPCTINTNFQQISVA